MRCPFLREVQVKSCCASPFKKMIVRTSDDSGSERCSSASWTSCPASKQHREEHPATDHCPFLHESLMQFCSAVPVPTYVPYSEAPLSRCSNENHYYCDVFLYLAEPGKEDSRTPPKPVAVAQREGVRYSPNHLWIDVHDDRTCHIGIDAFLARFLHSIERLSYVTTRSVCYPSIVVTVRGTDLPLLFPHKIQLTAVNTYLRARPSTVISHPYTLGWLFEGIMLDDQSVGSTASRTEEKVGTAQARRWLGQESRRLTEYVHSTLLAGRNREILTMADGGEWSESLITQLTRDELLQVWNEFFFPGGA